MGIYDRDYERNGGYGQQPGLRLDGPRSLTTNLVLLTLGIYLLQVFTQQGPHVPGWLTIYGSLNADVVKRPWLFFEFLTYGFLHDPDDFKHIVFNMIGLWFFGRDIEQRYGKKEYLAFYLVAIVFAGVAWCAAQWLMYGTGLHSSMLGASGGLSAILILFALNFPHRIINFWGIFPVPTWALAVFFVGADLLGALDRSGNVAYTAHLGGVLFGFLYYRYGWRVSHWLPSNISLPKPKRRTNLRIHEPEDQGSDQGSETDEIVDEILRKIQAHGQDSLTRRERRIMKKASQEYQRKRQ